LEPILKSIEVQFDRGNYALGSCVGIGHEIRHDFESLGVRLRNATVLVEQSRDGTKKSSTPQQHAELVSILEEMKQLVTTIDDSIPSISLWMSTVGAKPTETASFSPARLLQASMLVNVGDTQFIIDPSRPMQIGPDFTVSMYMLFKGHASAQDGMPYGWEAGQRKPTWQEVIHKARVRLYRVPAQPEYGYMHEMGQDMPPSRTYAYQLQIVEDLDDGRVHTFDDGDAGPAPYDGVAVAGIRDLFPVGDIAKMYYADVGKVLNIGSDDGADKPVLVLKRAQDQFQPAPTGSDGEQAQRGQILETIEEPSFTSESTLSGTSAQDDIDRQLREESQAADPAQDQVWPLPTQDELPRPPQWTIPQHFDPEFMVLEVFDMDDSVSSIDDDESEAAGEVKDDMPAGLRPPKSHATFRTSVDGNLVNQLHRMSLASGALPSSRPSSSHSHAHSYSPDHHQPLSTELAVTGTSTSVAAPIPTLIERSPFGAIRTSLSLLEMLLRLATLQELEQTTHLAVPDHLLRFFLDDMVAESGLNSNERWAGRADDARKVGFDPYADGIGAHGG
jgi:hypothetical protein